MGENNRSLQGTTICFMHMNDERILPVLILHFLTTRPSGAYQ